MQPSHASIPVELPDRFPVGGDLTGRRALVTGGSRGLGLAIACALGQAGAAVAIAGRNPQSRAAAVAEIRRRGAVCHAVHGDLSDVTSTAAMIDEAASVLGGLDLLVNNAGVGVRGSPEDLSENDFDRIFDTNVKGLYFASCAARRLMQRGSSIVNVASVAAHLADVELAAYSGSKAAVIQLTRILAASWGASGIRVNAVAPGYTDSPMNAHRKADPVRAAAVINRTPLGRWGKPADVAAAVVFLAGEGAAFITGQTLQVEGGYTLGHWPSPLGEST